MLRHPCIVCKSPCWQKKKGTLGSIAPATQGHKARSGGRWQEEERAGACGGNSICARLYECMGTMFSAMALSATQRRGWRGRRRRGSGAGGAAVGRRLFMWPYYCDGWLEEAPKAASA